MKPSPICRYLREVAQESVRSGTDVFTVDFGMAMDGRMGPSREGFLFKDELEIFCWLSGCTYSAEDGGFLGGFLGRSYRIRVPDSVFWEYHLERLTETRRAMESYG